MYLPRNLISHLYSHLLKTHHPLSPPVLILVALEPDALCACRILTSLLKRDYIPHKIHPVAGYGDLAHAGKELVQPLRLAEGGSGGVVACLGVGGLVDLENVLGLEVDEDGNGGLDGVEVWVFDSRRPYNLTNVFGGQPLQDTESGNNEQSLRKEPGTEKGEISRTYPSGKGGIIVFDDGDIQEELRAQREAWFALEHMPEVQDEDLDVASEASDRIEEDEENQSALDRKRKSPSDGEEDDASDKENARPHQRRKSNSSTPIPSSPPRYNRRTQDILQSTPPSNQQSSPPPREPSPERQPSSRALRRRFLRLRKKHENAIRTYHSLGTSYSEPVSSLMYSLASELGREDNDILWLAIIGVSSNELYGRTPTGVSLTNYENTAPIAHSGWTSTRGSRIRQILRDEVRRLNPPELTETGREVNRGGLASDTIPTHARSPTDTSIRLSPEPRFLLTRHWSLYDSMLHSPYLSAKLHIWSDSGRRRLHKLLAKMGMSLNQCKQNYTHMDMDLKKDLRQKLLHFAPMYGLEGLLPPPSNGRGGADTEGWGYVRCWGWKACLSATDVAVIIGAMLEAGIQSKLPSPSQTPFNDSSQQTSQSTRSFSSSSSPATEALQRFYIAYDALLSPKTLSHAIPLAQSLHRSILRTGTSLLQKKQIRHLRAFRMALVKEGPDIPLFINPGALIKLALWVGDAVAEMEKDADDDDEGGMGRSKRKKHGTPLVLGTLDEERGIYVVVGLGGGGGGSATSIRDKAEEERRKAEREKRKETKAKEKEERREAKRREKQQRREDDDQDDEDLETEDEDLSEDEEEEESSDEDDDEQNNVDSKIDLSRNKFGNAFQEVVEETNARVRLDSFEHCVVEVKKEDLSGFLESLSMKSVVG